MIAHHLPTLALMLALMLQADPGFVMWSVSELEGRNKALGAEVGTTSRHYRTRTAYRGGCFQGSCTLGSRYAILLASPPIEGRIIPA